jgi:hypothetical protein
VRRLLFLFLGVATLLAGTALHIVRPGSDADAQGLAVRARLPLLAADSVPGPATTTPFPTATGLATAVPTATPTPPPTSTPQPTGVYAHHASSYTSITGTIWIVGLVTNATGGPIDFVEITTNYYSASGQLLATDFGFADVSTMAPGTSSPFSVLLLDPPPGIVSFDYAVTDYDSDPFRPVVVGLVVNVTNIYRSNTGTVHVVGTVKNNSATAYEFVQPLAAFTDAAGNVVRTDFTFTSPDDLAPGQTGTFDMLFLSAPAGMENLNLLIWIDASYP